MKQIWKDFLFSCTMGLIVPWLVLGLINLVKEPGNVQREPTVTQVRQEKNEIQILIGTAEGPVQMELDRYLTGVVLAEMPASFEPEALKAQAVVARTYTMRAVNGKSKHENYAVCTDSSCCQSYISVEAYLQKGGTSESVEKIQAAVDATSGFVLTYDGALIEATYFSCSGGKTEDAVAVWGTDVPYLQSVDSPGEEKATHYTDRITFSAGEFTRRLSLDVNGDTKELLGEVTYTDGGGVKRMIIGGKRFEGTTLRKLLELPSTAFSIQLMDNTVIITTRGYGHRVGMSQYGADAMAATGKTFEEILAHYYSGTKLEQLPD